MNEKKIATIYDIHRLCKAHTYCDTDKCPLYFNSVCRLRYDFKYTDKVEKINDIVVKWCEEHPIQTRQSEFLKMFPNAKLKMNMLDICPKMFNTQFQPEIECNNLNCNNCKKEFWSQEVK